MLKLVLLLWSIIPQTGSAGCTLQSGRLIEAYGDAGGIQITAREDSARVRLGRHKIEVKPTQIMLDDQATFAIDESAKSVIVVLEHESLQLVVDDKPLATIHPDLQAAALPQPHPR